MPPPPPLSQHTSLSSTQHIGKQLTQGT